MVNLLAGQQMGLMLEQYFTAQGNFQSQMCVD